MNDLTLSVAEYADLLRAFAAKWPFPTPPSLNDRAVFLTEYEFTRNAIRQARP